jgi:transcriptional repressor NF-X1
LERNKRVSLALQIRNPDLSSKITPKYSDFMKDFAKKDAHFCAKIHAELVKLVQLAKEVRITHLYIYHKLHNDIGYMN